MLKGLRSNNFCHFSHSVDELGKLLKTKAFILEKFLDTAFPGNIRFLPESSDGINEPPLELFSLEKRPPGCRAASSFCSSSFIRQFLVQQSYSREGDLRR